MHAHGEITPLGSSSFGGEYASCAGRRVGAASTIGHGLTTALDQNAEPFLNVLQPRANQGAVSVIEPSAVGGSGRALSPTGREGPARVAPPQQVLQAPRIIRAPEVAAERAALLIRLREASDAALPLVCRLFERHDIVGEKVLMFLLQQGSQLGERAGLLRHESAELVPAGARFHGLRSRRGAARPKRARSR